jgi:hypothetical protein
VTLGVCPRDQLMPCPSDVKSDVNVKSVLPHGLRIVACCLVTVISSNRVSSVLVRYFQFNSEPLTILRTP